MQHVDDLTVVSPVGELDLASATALRGAIERALCVDATTVRIDLAAVTFLDSTALAVIVEGWRNASGRGVRYELTNPMPNVRRVLEITGLVHLVTE
jgi:anti-sigma B factor antagonist